MKMLTPVVTDRLDMLYVDARVPTEALAAAIQTEVARSMVKRFVGPRLSVAQRVEFDERGVDWSDRLIVGDSRIVMDSFLGCDLMVGKVETIYLDPPPDEATDGDPTREVDRTYLRDRLVLCRELL